MNAKRIELTSLPGTYTIEKVGEKWQWGIRKSEG
jgi:hypothetical protein